MSRRRPSVLRRLLLLALAVVMLPVLAIGGFFVVAFATSTTNTSGDVDFDRELAIPRLAESDVEDGVRTFRLRAQEGSTDYGADRRTPTWGFNGDVLGPTLRAERGEKVRVEVTNDLGETTTVHWHGMHLPAKADGGPHQMVEPGQTWRPSWRIDQPAASLWYHPHVHGKTAEHVYRGLAGMFLIDDEESSALDLPDEYGVDDVPLILQDKKLERDGGLDESGAPFADTGVLGDTVTVNGTVRPYLDVGQELTRFRVLNGSNARVWNLGLDDDSSFQVIGSDGGLLEAPVTAERLRLSPGERAEVVVRSEPGERRVLRSYPTDDPGRFEGGGDTLDVMELRPRDDLDRSADLPQRLVDVPRLDPADADEERSFRVSSSSINDRPMDMSRIDEVVTVGDTEVWTIRRWGGTHNFHVHDVQFQVLDVAGRRPPPEQRGWKDTVWLPPDGDVRVIMRFTDYTDPDVPYMFHCHLLKHEDQGAMGQFVVVEPGQQPGRVPTTDHEH